MSSTEEGLRERESTESPNGVSGEPVGSPKTDAEIQYPSTIKQALIILGLLLSSFLVSLSLIYR